MNNFKRFITEEDGMGTVEIVLIIVVLIALVTLFKKEITNIVKGIMTKIKNNANAV